MKKLFAKKNPLPPSPSSSEEEEDSGGYSEGSIIDSLSESVLRIFVTTLEYDYDQPWQSKKVDSCSGSGCCVSLPAPSQPAPGPLESSTVPLSWPGDEQQKQPQQKRYVLTAAHVVSHASFIQVQRAASGNDKVPALIVAINHEADLALLEVEDGLLEQVEPVSFEVVGGEKSLFPRLRDRVNVLGFPVGGDSVSATEGIVSRIELQEMAHSGRYLVCITIDAAVNPGASGGPTFGADGALVGVAVQAMDSDEAENISEIVPLVTVRRFLYAFSRGGLPFQAPSLGVSWVWLENATLRRSVGLDKASTGVLVTHVEYGSSAHGVVREGDVMTSIAGHPIANNGTVKYLGQHRMAFSVVSQQYFVGSEVEVGLLRAGEAVTACVKLREEARLVPRMTFREPTYCIFAGCVFQPLSAEYMDTWESFSDCPAEFQVLSRGAHRSESRSQVVVFSSVLSDRANTGFESHTDVAVDTVNGAPVKDMVDFVTRVAHSTGLVKIRCSDHSLIVIDMDSEKEVMQRIVSTYRLPATCSTDVQKVLEESKSK